MSQHYPKSTLEAPKWCKTCNKSTPHRVFNGVLSRVCIPCQEKAEEEHQERLRNPEPPQPVQEALFA